MPKPGHRSYECIRRAWHSDRHQPMRGSLIREIFRVVNEVHSASTKKNKEWQEKLPLVVLKAEEIMYSKANSEAEYMDLKTLWERTNDAIDTIIRRDESTETESGDLLQPCIEAALILGCSQRRASRSQRHNNPRYLTPATQETSTQMSGARKYLEIAAYDGSSCLLPPHCGIPISYSSPEFASYYSPLLTPTNVSKTQLGLDSSNAVIMDKAVPSERRPVPPTSSCEFSSPEKFRLLCKDKPSLQRDPSLKLGGMYPVYYSSKCPAAESGAALSCQHCSNCDANLTLVQRPEEAEPGRLLNIGGCCYALDASNRPSSGAENIGGMRDDPPLECDLSLRLGPQLTPCLNADDNSVVEDSGTCSWDRFCDPTMSGMKSDHFDDSFLLPQRNQGFCFFPGESSKASWRYTSVNRLPRG